MTRHRTFEIFLHATVFLFCFEMAAGFSFYLLEICLLGLGIAFVRILWCEYREKPAAFLQELKGRVSGAKRLLAALAVYLCLDGLGWFIGNLSLGISKYKVVAPMLFLSLCLLYYCEGEKQLDRIFVNLGSMAAFTAVMAFANYLFVRIYPIYYTLRISLRTDYNMFATTLFFGGVCGVFWWIRRKDRGGLRGVVFPLYAAVIAAAILLSGSRRIFILLLPTCFVLVFLWLIYGEDGKKTTVVSLALTAAACLCLTIGIQKGMEARMEEAYQAYGSYGPGSALSREGSGATTAAQRYESIAEPSLFEKRRILWGIAVSEAGTYTPVQLAVGKGGGYDIDLYDRVDSRELQQSYTREIEKGTLSAHNFLLADLLGGGILKLLSGTAVWLCIGALIWKLITRDIGAGVFCGVLSGLVLMNNLISNRYGFLYDKFFYLAVMILILILSKGDGDEEGLHDDLGAQA